MCRITGFWDFRQTTNYNKDKIITDMRDTMVYGGPDDCGYYISKKKNVALGHRRLSILDLSVTGHQPMKSNNSNIWITYNGEIYNFNEIKKELINKGYRFKSSSDTEVILKSYQEWGIKCIEKFIGMFAFVIWDEDNEKMVLIRDRAGIKPLYYYLKDGIFIFGSELKPFYKFPDFKKIINYDALFLFFQFGHIQAPYTIFKDTYKLEPGYYLELNKNGKLKKVKYWDIADYYKLPRIKKNEKEIEEELEYLLIKSFKYRLVSDVPVGVFLSGGIDSSAVTALLQKNINSQLKTFTIGFDQPEYNEACYAKKVAEVLKTDHTEFYCTVDDLYDIFEKFQDIYDEPFGDSSGIPTYLVSKLARKNVKVALSADGGDELFAGYTKYEIVDKYYKYLSRVPFIIRFFGAGMLELLSPEFVEKLYENISCVFPLPKFTNLKDKFYKFRNIIKEDKLNNIFKVSGSYANRKLLDKILKNKYNVKLSTNFDTIKQDKRMDNFSYMQMIDFKTYMPDDILTKVDRATMQNSLEGREPFLDHELVQYIAQLPWDLKYRNNISKWILRKILYKYVPEELLNRPKMGFGIPIYKWLRENLLNKYNDVFDTKFLNRQNIFNINHLSELFNKFKNGKGVNAHFIWFVFIFQRWYKKWM